MLPETTTTYHYKRIAGSNIQKPDTVIRFQYVCIPAITFRYFIEMIISTIISTLRASRLYLEKAFYNERTRENEK